MLIPTHHKKVRNFKNTHCYLIVNYEYITPMLLSERIFFSNDMRMQYNKSFDIFYNNAGQ